MPRKITLNIIGAEQDVPRQVSGYVSLKGGREMAFVLNPGSGYTVARIITTGKGKNAVSSATVSQSSGGSVRVIEASVAEALAAVKDAKAQARKAGPVTIRGQWSGHAHIEDDGRGLKLHLTRKVATYGTLTIESVQDKAGDIKGWTGSMTRKAQWFASGTSEDVTPSSMGELAEAITYAYQQMLGVVQAACGIRDTQRRQALDADYASRYPIKPAREPKNPRVEVFLAKKRAVTPPKTAPAQKKMVESIQKDASEARAALSHPTVTHPPSDPSAEFAEIMASWRKGSFRFGAYLDELVDLADTVEKYAKSSLGPGDETISLSDFAAQVRARVTHARIEGEHSEHEIREMDTEVDLVLHLLQSAPAILARVGALLKYAEATIQSPKCTGREQKEAVELLEDARRLYVEAKGSIYNGALDQKALRAVRQSLEKLALSAAKAGRSCGAGQTSLDLKGSPPKKATSAPKKASVSPKDVGTWSYLGKVAPASRTGEQHTWERRLPEGVEGSRVRRYMKEEPEGGRWRAYGIAPPYVVHEVMRLLRAKDEATAVEKMMELIAGDDDLETRMPVTIPEGLHKQKGRAVEIAKEAVSAAAAKAGIEVRLLPPKRGSLDTIATFQFRVASKAAAVLKAVLADLEAQASGAAAPAKTPRRDTVTAPAAKPKKAPAPAAPAAPAASADKDAILMSAFQSAIAQVIAGNAGKVA